MAKAPVYSDMVKNPAITIVDALDKDVEQGEDILMLGYGLILAAPLFAPITSPTVLLPMMALVFLFSVCAARHHLHKTAHKFKTALLAYQDYDFTALNPILKYFSEHPEHSLADGFNPTKNIARTLKSFLGSLLINPLWMPVFYLLGMQFTEEKQFHKLNVTVIKVEERLKDCQKK